MFLQRKVRKFLWMALSLLLFVMPLQGVAGQELPVEDTVAETVMDSDGLADQGEPQAVSDDGLVSEVVSPIDATAQSYRQFLPVIQGSNEKTEQVVAAFTHTWVLDSCINVINANSDRGLWDDMPGPGGANNEAGLLWFNTNDGLNEQCAYRTTLAGVTANQLRFRVAVNDNARFSVTVYRVSGAFCLPHATLQTGTTQDDNQFRIYPPAAPFTFIQATICRVQIRLTDDPDTLNFAVDRSTALIDYIRLFNNGVQTWEESFTN